MLNTPANTPKAGPRSPGGSRATISLAAAWSAPASALRKLASGTVAQVPFAHAFINAHRRRGVDGGKLRKCLPFLRIQPGDQRRRSFRIQLPQPLDQHGGDLFVTPVGTGALHRLEQEPFEFRRRQLLHLLPECCGVPARGAVGKQDP